MGAIILIWPRLNQMSNLPKLQNYGLGRDGIYSELLSDFPSARGYLVFQRSVLSSYPLSSGLELRLNLISSVAEQHPANYLFLQGERRSNVLLMERKLTSIRYDSVMCLKSRPCFLLLKGCQQEGRSARFKSPCLVFGFRLGSK